MGDKHEYLFVKPRLLRLILPVLFDWRLGEELT